MARPKMEIKKCLQMLEMLERIPRDKVLWSLADLRKRFPVTFDVALAIHKKNKEKNCDRTGKAARQ